ncbi:MAG: hypothetical protein P4L93_04315 [Coriobacteriia bacterium]|nr:hypothetical protein [Coriobacteriia bacterium]
MKRCILACALAVALAGAALGPSAALAAQDQTPPSVTAFSLTPQSVNTESQDQTITLTVTLTDDQSGVSTANDGGYNTVFYLKAPSGTQYVTALPTRVSGTQLNGVYQATMVLPRGSTKGVWTVWDFFVIDKVGNTRDLRKADLEAKFGAGVANVTNTAADDDSVAPNITAFSLTPQTVNTESQDQTVTVKMTLTDNQSGVSTVGDGKYNTVLYLKAPSGSQYVTLLLKRVSGDDRNGQYEATAVLRRGATQGVWTVWDLYLIDKLQNTKELTAADLNSSFGAGAANVNNTATHSDSTAPLITSFDISPQTIDTDSQPQTLTLTVELTDTQAGVSTAWDGPYSSVLYLQPLIGSQYTTFNLKRVSGTDMDGIYQASVVLPQGAKEGVWVVWDMFLTDKLGNTRELHADDINGLLPGSKGVTVVNTALAQQVTIERDWSIATTHTLVTFPADTVVTRQGGGEFAFYKMTGSEFSVDGSTPTTDLAGNPVATLRLGIPGLDLSFSRGVTVSLFVGDALDGYWLQIQSLEESGTAWANETQVPVANGRATFTVNHASYFVGSLMARPRGTIKINRGAKTTHSAYVTLYLYASDPLAKVSSMRFSDNGRKWTTWKTYRRTSTRWSLTSKKYGGTAKKGYKYVYVQYRDAKKGVSVAIGSRIRLR